MKLTLLGKTKLSVVDTVVIAIMIALNLILGRFTYSSTIVQISLGFVIIFYAGMWFGPLWAAFIAMISDLLNVFLSGGAYFPEFTLSAIVGGLISGWVMYNHRPTLKRIIVVQLIIAILVNLIMNTAWIVIINHIPLKAILSFRLIKELVGTPIQILILFVVTRFAVINRTFREVTSNK